MDAFAAYFDPTTWITSLSILALLVLSGCFSGSETALTAASRGKLRAQAEKGSKGAETALHITEDNERLIGSVLLGNNLVNILAASLATALFTRLFGESGVALATIVMTLLVLIFAEVLPKTYAITNPETAAARAAPVIVWVIRIFNPVVAAVRWLVIPKVKDPQQMLVAMIIGLALSEMPILFSLFLIGSDYPQFQIVVLMLAVVSLIQFAPSYATPGYKVDHSDSADSSG